MAGADPPSPYRVPTFTYSGPPEGPAYEAWREEFCRRFCQLDAESPKADRIECTVEISQFGSLSFGTAYGTSGSLQRTRSLVSDGQDDLVLLTAINGPALAVQRGRSLELKPSEMCLTSLAHIGESRLSEGGRYTALRMPRRDLQALSKNIEDRIATPLHGNPGLKEFIGRYSALCAETAPMLDPVGQQVMARQMLELVALLAAPGRLEAENGGGGQDVARLHLIQAYVRENVHDCGLTLAAVARRVGMSPRQVQRAFEPTEASFSEFVLEQRLLLAHRLLSAPAARLEKVSVIALDAGFNDLSYFNRTFRRRFGMTPGEWREAALGN